MKILNWLVDNFEFVLLLAVSAIGFALDYRSGELSIATIAGLLIAIAIFLAIKNYRMGVQIRSISESVSAIKTIVAHMTATEVLYGREACFRKLNAVIDENSRIDATYFSKPPLPEKDQLSNEKRYWSNLLVSLRTKGNDFQVRRIVTVESPEKLKWVKGMFKELKNCPQFHLAVLSTEQPFPLTNLIVIDGRYTMLFGPHEIAGKGQYVFIDNDAIAESFYRHFEDLWRVAERSIPLKIGQDIYPDNLKKLEEIVAGR